ncbi:hypothetical protein [Teichococcus vastitatis]|uniref:hypothetical protein n=1 Tax=Teichococcus vastitatis TaxID=2307076 RepID=UPI000E765FDD|nr:hypothetical protein [Pseudoroseomonas vastitatis]
MTLTPDPHGQAAFMLCEALALLLVENGVIPKEQVTGAIDGIIELKQEIAGRTESVVVSVASIGLLRNVSQSIAVASIYEPTPHA